MFHCLFCNLYAKKSPTNYRLISESPSQIPNLPHTKPLYLYSALYNEHQKLRRTAKEVSKNISRRIRDMKVLQHPHTANHNQLSRS